MSLRSASSDPDLLATSTSSPARLPMPVLYCWRLRMPITSFEASGLTTLPCSSSSSSRTISRDVDTPRPKRWFSGRCPAALQPSPPGASARLPRTLRSARVAVSPSVSM